MVHLSQSCLWVCPGTDLITIAVRDTIPGAERAFETRGGFSPTKPSAATRKPYTSRYHSPSFPFLSPFPFPGGRLEYQINITFSWNATDTAVQWSGSADHMFCWRGTSRLDRVRDMPPFEKHQYALHPSTL